VFVLEEPKVISIPSIHVGTLSYNKSTVVRYSSVMVSQFCDELDAKSNRP